MIPARSARGAVRGSLSLVGGYVCDFSVVTQVAVVGLAATQTCGAQEAQAADEGGKSSGFGFDPAGLLLCLGLRCCSYLQLWAANP